MVAEERSQKITKAVIIHHVGNKNIYKKYLGGNPFNIYSNEIFLSNTATQ